MAENIEKVGQSGEIIFSDKIRNFMLNTAKIFSDISTLKQFLVKNRPGYKVVATSGGFDPLHKGHLRCIQGCSTYGNAVVVIVNGDGFLVRKKGKPFMVLDERMEIIAGLIGVDFVVPWDDGTQTVEGAIRLLKPDFFAKGGDRDHPDKIPEWAACQEVNCEIIFGVGGDKIQSSSNLLNSYQDASI